MTARDLLNLVCSNLLRMKARVAMTAVGVVIGTAAVVVLISLAVGLQRSATQDLGSIGELTEITVFPGWFIRSLGGGAAPGSSGEKAVLNDRTLDEFRDLPGVVAVTPWESLAGGGRLRLNRLVGGAQIIGVDAREIEKLEFKLASGTARLGRWQALVGGAVAEGFYDPSPGVYPRTGSAHHSCSCPAVRSRRRDHAGSGNRPVNRVATRSPR